MLVARGVRRELATAQHVFVGGEVVGGFGEGAVPLEAGQLHRCGADDAPSDILLHPKDVVDLGIVCLRPDVPPRRGLAQLGVDANAIPGAANAAIEQIARVEPASDLGRCQAAGP